MITLKYVGLKESETAFSNKTTIVWTQGMTADVSDEHAALMLSHPDVFAIADADEQPEITDTLGKEPKPKPKKGSAE